MLNILKRRWPAISVVLAFLLLFGQAVRSGFQPGMPAFGDAWPFPPTVAEAVKAFLSVWDSRNPGLNMPAVTVISFFTAFEAFLGAVLGGRMTLAAQLFYFYLPLPLMFLSMYWFLGKFSLARSAKFVASFIYSANLFSVGELLGGFPGTNYVQVLFPLIVFCLYRRKFFQFSLLFALAYVFSDHVVIFMAPFFLIFLIRGFWQERFRGLIKDLAFIINSAALVILLTLPYTYYYFKVAFPFLGGSPLREDVLAFLVRNVNDTYRYYTLGDSLRLGGSAFGSLYGLSDFAAKAGFLLPLLAFSWIFLPANWRKNRILPGLVLSLLAAATVAFIYDAHRSEAITLFRHFPFFFRFRNPARPTLFLTFTYAPLIALTLDGLQQFVLSKLNRKAAVAFLAISMGTIFVFLSFYFQPFYSGDYTFAKNRSTTYTVSQRYNEVKNWLDVQRSMNGPFRTLWLPYNHEEVEMKIRYIDPYAYAVPINYGTYMDNGYLRFMKRIYLKMSLGDYSVLDDLGQAGVRYLILNEESQDGGKARFEYDYLTPWLPGSAANWRRLVLSLPGVGSKEEVSGFSIYENPRFSPEKVDPTLAGYPPADLAQLQRTKDLLIIVSTLAGFMTLAGIIGPWLVQKRGQIL